MHRLVLTLSCPDRLGIVAAIATRLRDHACNIVESAQFRDEDGGDFLMRVCVDSPRASASELVGALSDVRDDFSMDLAVHDLATTARVLVLVSKFGHCLNDLLYRHRIGNLPATIVGVLSNHRDFASLCAEQGVPFHFAPSNPEKQLLELVRQEECDLVLLARYMQILSPEVCRELAGRVINIHHSFLPSFVGARPYEQAYHRGVKLIGATAHYVTEDVDEGPIIEQDVARVDHSMRVEDYASVGRDIECAVLARAVKWHLEHRVLIHGRRTIVFR